MKSSFTSLVGISLLILTTLSCSKKNPPYDTERQAIAPQVLAAKVLPGDTYTLSMGAGTSASIVTQALHYQLSQISTASDGSAVYKYVPGKGFTGADEVTLQQTITSITSGGGCHNSNHSNQYSTTATKTTVIKFNVAN